MLSVFSGVPRDGVWVCVCLHMDIFKPLLDIWPLIAWPLLLPVVRWLVESYPCVPSDQTLDSSRCILSEYYPKIVQRGLFFLYHNSLLMIFLNIFFTFDPFILRSGEKSSTWELVVFDSYSMFLDVSSVGSDWQFIALPLRRHTRAWTVIGQGQICQYPENLRFPDCLTWHDDHS